MCLGAISTASHARDFPERVVRIVIPYPPGGGSDAQARALAHELTKQWKQQVIVENKPGAGTTIAAAYIASSPPDGYTLYLNSVSHTVAPSLYTNLRYDAVKSFTAISKLSESPFVIAVNPASQVKSIADLLALARREPGKLNFGTTGIGAGPHLAAEELIADTKIKAQHIPYNGTAPLQTALLGNFVDFGFVDPGALPSIKAGALRGLAVTTIKRSPVIPDVPTIDETVIKGFDVANWSSILAPAGMSQELVNFISESVHTALKSPELVKQFELQGFEPSPTSPEELRAFMVSEIKKYHDILERAGVKPH
jgi:tripartite-type tricarboxylate transporter receptor subunit TctC